MRPHTLKRSGRARRRILAALAAASVAAVLLLPSSAVSAPSQPPAAVQTVVVVLAPFLTWDDVSGPDGTSLTQMAADGALGNMTAITADPGWPTVSGGALTLGAGRWAAAPTDHALKPSELAAIEAANAHSLDPPVIGTLGSAIRSAGRKTAAVGCSDENTSTPGGVRRPAALLAMDESGTVDVDLTGPGLLAADPSAPSGVRAGPKQLRTAVRVALADDPALLVVDPGDLERAHDASAQPAEQAAAHASAVAALGDVVADVQAATAGRTVLVMVLAPATDKPYYQPPYFAPIIVRGQGLLGELTSPSTHRSGIVTNLDIAPTILRALGIDPPPSLVGEPVTASSTAASAQAGSGASAAPSVSGEIAQLKRLDIAVGSIDFIRDIAFIRVFAWGALAIAVIATAIALIPQLRRFGALGRILLAFALSFPPGAWLMFLVIRYPADPQQATIAFSVATLATFALVMLTCRAFRAPAEMPVLALSTLTSLLILADQWTGRPFETGLFSYSVRAGWRYYGMGNEGAALLVGASIVAVGLACDLLGGGRYARSARLLLMPLVGGVCLLTASAPFAGANAGVALWGVIAYAVAWMRVNRVRLGVRSVLGIFAAIVLLVAALVAIDLVRGAGETHLGRFFSDALRGDFSAVWTIVYRKAANNLGYISQTPYTWLALGLAVSLAGARWLGARPLAQTLRERPGLSAAVLGVVVGGVAAALTEDSGVVMPALMLFAGGLPALYLALPSTGSEQASHRNDEIPRT